MTQTQSPVVHNTFVIERNYPVTPDRVFAAFADPARKRRWYAESDGHDVEEFHMDFRVGGVERARYRFKEGTPFKGIALANEGTFHDIVPDQRIVISSTMSFGDRRISATLTTFELVPNGTGTDLILTHQGVFFEGSDGPQRREEGWRKILDRLAAALAR